MWKRVLLLGLLLCAGLLGCSNQDETSEATSEAADYAGAEPLSRQITEQSESIEEDSGNIEGELMDDGEEHTDASSLPSERMVIYEAYVGVEVEKYDEAEQAFQAHAEEMGGYLVDSSYYEVEEGQASGTLVFRVPKEQFQPFLDLVENSSIKLLNREVSGEDVTEEYVDLESRLRSKRMVEERLLSFMEDADSTENLLNISKELGRVQEEIEQILGRQKYLNERVDYSTITVEVTEKQVQISTLQGDENLHTWSHAQKLFMDTINTILLVASRLVVLIIGLSPVLVPLLLLSGVGYWYWRKKRKSSEL